MRTSAAEEYGCTECRDTGWIVEGEPGKERARRCVPCAVMRWDAMAARRFPSRSPLTWKAWVKRAELREQVKALYAWRGDPWCVFLHGGDESGSDNRGAGKTHAAMATGRLWVELGLSVVAWDWSAYMQRCKAAITNPAAEPLPLEDSDALVILDDVGERDVQGQPARPPSAYDLDALTRLLKAREARLLPTVVTTNLGLAEFDRKFYRASSRLETALRLRWIAESWRRR